MRRLPLYTTLSILFLSATSVALLPIALSSSWGKPLVERKLSQLLKARCSLTSASFSWVGPQRFHGLVAEKEKVMTLRLEEGVIYSPFWMLRSKESWQGTAELSSLHLGVQGSRLEIGEVKLTRLAEQLDLQLAGQTQSTAGTGQFSGTIECHDLTALEPQISFHLEGSNVAVEPWDALVATCLGSAPGALLKGLGPVASFSLEWQGTADQPAIRAHIVSSGCQLDLAAKTQEGRLTLEAPATAALEMNGEKLILQISQASLPLRGGRFDLEQLTYKTSLQLTGGMVQLAATVASVGGKEITTSGTARWRGGPLLLWDGAKVAWNATSWQLAHPTSLRIDSKTLLMQQILLEKGPHLILAGQFVKMGSSLSLDLRLPGGWNGAQAVAELRVKDLPTTWMLSWTALPFERMIEMLGEKLSCSADLQAEPGGKALQISILGAESSLTASLFVGPRYVELELPLVLRCKWPAGLHGGIELLQPATLDFQLSRCRLPVSTPSAWYAWPNLQGALKLATYQMSLKTEELRLRDPASGALYLVEGLWGKALSNSSDAPLPSLQLEANVSSQRGGDVAPHKGTVAIQGEGALNDGFWRLKMVDLPLRLVDIALTDLALPPHAEAVVGYMASAALEAKVTKGSGKLEAWIRSPNLQLEFAGELGDGLLTLSKRLRAELMATKELSQLFFTDGTSVISLLPATLEVAVEGFALPLFPFVPSGFYAPHVALDLGKLLCSNGSNFKITSGLLKNSQLATEGSIPLWTAPTDLHINKGIIDLERMEMLLGGSYQLALWGQIDLVKRWADLKLGIPAITLQRAFGIPKLPPSYIISLPLTGSLDAPKLDTSSATSSIVALMIWQQKGALSQGVMKGNPAGALLGGIVDQIPPPGGDSSAPPARPPFPWQDGQKEEQSSKKSRKKNKLGKILEKKLKRL